MSLLQNFISRFIPVVKADDEELVDPQKVLRVSITTSLKTIT